MNLPPPPQELMQAMQMLRSGNPAGALQLIEQALPSALERGPFLAIGSLAALHIEAFDRAIPYLRELVQLNPADRASRNNLAAALVQSGDDDGALAIAAGSTDAPLARIEGYIQQKRGRYQEALAAYRRAIEADPNDLAALNNLGNIYAELGEVEEAITAFEQAITLAPVEVPIYLNLAEVLREAERGPPRVKVLEDARAIEPDNVRVLTDLGMAYAQVDDLDKSMEVYRDAISRLDGFGEAHIEYGMLLEKLNRIEDLDALVAGLDKESAPPEASFLFAWQARRAGDFEAAARYADAIPETVLPMRRWQLVGGVADRQNLADKAFAAFEKMNEAAVAKARPHVGKTYRQRVEADLALWTPEWRASWTPASPGNEYRDPVFLVGFPRSGTTLLDTMLMGHPALSVLEEKPMIPRLVRHTMNEDIATLTPERIAELRDMYFAIARDNGWDDSRWLLDKHPLNMQRIPLIKRLFPSAKFILAERHPYDVVLSCFMANFTLNLGMRSFTDLDEAAKTYDAVWQSWHRGLELFDVDWRAVRYERLVVDTENELQPIAEWLGLEVTERMLDHTTTAKSRGHVRTASYSQIGEELYTRASYRWRRYAPHLRGVMPILHPWAERMGYPVEEEGEAA
ncbi:sulfotransferase [Qipengyuania sp. RANM35]|uniref:tetratricopeptide repeat-containing sulfotransferase family protein n=1 Tax=Qipengyuania sp. RANM35 TaxID=3068635 RepID=UPI0034DB29C8